MEQQNVEKAENDLEVVQALFPTKNMVTLDSGRTVEVSKIKMKHNEFVLRLIRKVVEEVGLDGEGNVTIALGDKVELLKLISKFPNDINELISVFTGLTMDEVGELDTADGILCVMKIVEVNHSFFIEKVAPLMATTLGVEKAAVEGQRVKRTRKS